MFTPKRDAWDGTRWTYATSVMRRCRTRFNGLPWCLVTALVNPQILLRMVPTRIAVTSSAMYQPLAWPLLQVVAPPSIWPGKRILQMRQMLGVLMGVYLRTKSAISRDHRMPTEAPLFATARTQGGCKDIPGKKAIMHLHIKSTTF